MLMVSFVSTGHLSLVFKSLNLSIQLFDHYDLTTIRLLIHNDYHPITLFLRYSLTGISIFLAYVINFLNNTLPARNLMGISALQRYLEYVQVRRRETKEHRLLLRCGSAGTGSCSGLKTKGEFGRVHI